MNRRIILCIVSTFYIFVSHSAQAITFEAPIICPESGYCYIQNYVDVSPVKGGQDYNNSLRSYDGHKGTDFRIPYSAMVRGVPVVAAAEGKVLRIRDGMDDVYLSELEDDINGYECGNGVVIDHGDGWCTQYCHMKRGSVAVKPGDVVRAGAVLGAVGLSGRTEFAHLHFQVTHSDEIVCPFSGSTVGVQSKEKTFVAEGDSLWMDRELEMLRYVSPQLLKIDFVTELPKSSRDILRRPEVGGSITVGRKPLVFAAVTALLKKGDRLIIALSTSEGRELARKVVKIKSHTAQRYDYVGRANSAKYVGDTLVGKVELWRQGTRMLQHRARVKVE